MDNNPFADLIPNQNKSSYNAQDPFADLLPENNPKTTIGRVNAGIEGALAFVPWDDELRASGRAIRTGKPYDDTLQEIRDTYDAAYEYDPYSYMAGGVLSGIGQGVAGGTALSTSKYANMAMQAMPKTTALGLGAVSGGVHAFGTGRGGAKERLEDSALGAAFGAGGGLAGYLGGKYVAEPIAKRLSKAPVEEGFKATDGAISQRPASSVEEMSQKANQVKLLKGARNQDVDLMRQEAMARQGLLGGELEAGVRHADDEFYSGIKDTMQGLAGKTEETAQDTLLKPIRAFQSRQKAEKKLMNGLMEKRNDAIARTKVYSDYTKNTLISDLDALKQTPDFKVTLQSTPAIADDLKFIKKLTNQKNINSVSMSVMSAWRRKLNTYKTGTPEGVLAGQMKSTYDNWLMNITKNALKEGDDGLADKIINANKQYAAFKSKYGTDKYAGQKNVIEKLIQENEMTPRAMVNSIFGKSMDGKDYTEQFVKRIVTGLPEGVKRQQAIEGFRSGLYQRAFENAYDSTTDTIKLAPLKKNLTQLLMNDSYKKYLSSPDHVRVTKGLIDDITKYQRAISDPTIVNTSGTAPFAARILQGLGSMPILRNSAVVRGVAEGGASVAKSGAKAPVKRSVEKSLAEFYKELDQLNRAQPIPLSGVLTGSTLTSETQ